MKARDQRPSRSSRSGAQTASLDKENESDERRVTRSMRKSEDQRASERQSVDQGQTEGATADPNSGSFKAPEESEAQKVEEAGGVQPEEPKGEALKAATEVSQGLERRKNKKVLRKSKRGRSKKKSKHRQDAGSVGKMGAGAASKNQGLESRAGGDAYSVSELDMDITSVTLINENSACTPSSGGASRMAKISWSRFDSFFRRIPMGARKEIILKTIPTNPALRKPIIQELTTLEQTLFTDPPWGKIGRASPYIGKANLSLPPIYLKSCSLDAIVDIVSKSILKSRGGNPSKMPLEIQKPYFLLFELPDTLSLVALEPKSPQELGISETGLEGSITTHGAKVAFGSAPGVSLSGSEAAMQLDATQSQGLEIPDAQDTQNAQDALDSFNIKWDILQTLSLSYYQFKYIERYLHDVFFNYDHSHKKVFFTPARINNQQDQYTVNVFERIRADVDELNHLVNLHIPSQTQVKDDPEQQQEAPSPAETLFRDEPVDLTSMMDEFSRTHGSLEARPGDSDSGPPAPDHEKQSQSSGEALPSQTSHVPPFRDDVWGTYRSYDPIYWWIDFVQSSEGQQITTEAPGGLSHGSAGQNKVFLHNNGLSYIDAPECVEVGGLYWLDPSKPIRLTREIRDLHRFGMDAQNPQEAVEEQQQQLEAPKTTSTILIHPYMMNDFVDHKDFNFVEANLERFLPIYNEIVDSIAKLRLKIQSRIIHENENKVKITDIPFIWMNVVQRYQIVNSWNKLKFFLVNGYKDLHPAFLRQADISKKMESVQTVDSESRPKDEKKTKVSKLDVLLESREKNVHLTNVCTVCFNWETNTLRPFVECVRCGMVSHVACYGVNIPLNELLDFYGWLCDRCEYEKRSLGTQYLVSFNPGSISCVLCSHSGGALKRTNKEGEWTHLVCAIWHLPLVVCEDWKNLSGWNVDRLRRSWTNKKIHRPNNPSRIASAARAGSSGSVLESPATPGIQEARDYGQKSMSSISSNSIDAPVSGSETVSPESRLFEDSKDLELGHNQGPPTGPAESCMDNPLSPGHGHGDPECCQVRCVFCRNDNTLGLVGCSQKDCAQFFHPICAWLNGVQVEVDSDPNYSRGETLVGFIQGWRNVQDEALQLVNIKCYCLSHTREKEGSDSRNLAEEVSLRRKRYVNRDMFPDLFNSKYNQKSSRGSQVGVIQRSRTRSISRSKSWDVASPSMNKKSSCEMSKQNQIYYYSALNPDKYDLDICCICLKHDSTDFPSQWAPPRPGSGPPAVQMMGSPLEAPGSGITLTEEAALPSNMLVRCICCGVTVHWSCYGVEGRLRSLEDFVCQACAKGVRPESTACILCPRRGGALIEAQGIPPGLCGKSGNKAQFLHVTCALYTPGVYILPNGQAYGVSNYLGMTSLVRLQKDASIGKAKGSFVRRFGGIEGSVQQLPFRDIRNEEQFILDQFSEQDALEIPNVYCCICKSSYGVNLACNFPGCTRTAHPLCMKLYGCYMETEAEVEDPLCGLDHPVGSIAPGDQQQSFGGGRPGSSSSILYVSPNCQPPAMDASAVRHSFQRRSYFTQKVFCPEHGRQMGRLNPGGKLLNSTLSSLKIVGKILEDLRHLEKAKRQLYSTQLDIMSRENPIFSPLMIRNVSALQIYWNYHSRGILQESVKIRNGTINKFRDNPKNGSLLKPLLANGDPSIFGGSKSPKRNNQPGAGLQTGPANPPHPSGATQGRAAGLKRTRSSGEAAEVPSLEDAIKEARRQREIYKKELVASGVVLKKRPPPNRAPSIPFSRLTDEELKQCALNCLSTIGSSSKLAMSLMTGYNPEASTSMGAIQTDGNAGPELRGFPPASVPQAPAEKSQLQSPSFGNGVPKIRSFCIKQHRHDCFRRRLAEFILYPPPVMDHRRKTLRSLTRQLKQHGVTAEELLASDIPLPLTKSKPAAFPPAGQGMVQAVSRPNLGNGPIIGQPSTPAVTTVTNTNSTAAVHFGSCVDSSMDLTLPTPIAPSSSAISPPFSTMDCVNPAFIPPSTGAMVEPAQDPTQVIHLDGHHPKHNLYF
ncbi:PHD domain-containing protein [Cryptosporidium canis]|uniref:PHD domain-containing protein n=1 Tax=Cryptosporidium canis TaxID=195482 RepID=A0ABQ8P588_9CRYT|nr:PHD domain-containing protein [Cryptosporidium canis]